jgi:hypothetical protein
VSKKDPVERTFFTSLKIVDEADTNNRIPMAKPSFSHSYRIEKSAVQVYISPSLFITENENMKQTCE